jgi:hypothetical protein
VDVPFKDLTLGMVTTQLTDGFLSSFSRSPESPTRILTLMPQTFIVVQPDFYGARSVRVQNSQALPLGQSVSHRIAYFKPFGFIL